MTVRGKEIVTKGSGGGGREIYLLGPQVSLLAIGNKNRVMLRQPAVAQTQHNVHKVASSEYLRPCKWPMTWRYPVHGFAGYLVGSYGVFDFVFCKIWGQDGYDIRTPLAGTDDIKTVGTG